jgi:hypothetical protein
MRTHIAAFRIVTSRIHMPANLDFSKCLSAFISIPLRREIFEVL